MRLNFQGEKIQTILKAANVEVEPYWPGLFAKALEGINIKDLITNVGSGVGAAPAGGGTFCIFKFLYKSPHIIHWISELANSVSINEEIKAS